MVENMDAYLKDLERVNQTAYRAAQVSAGTAAGAGAGTLGLLTGFVTAAAGVGTTHVAYGATAPLWNAAYALQNHMGWEAFNGLVITSSTAGWGSGIIGGVMLKIQGGKNAVTDIYAVSDIQAEQFAQEKGKLISSRDILRELESFTSYAQERRNEISRGFDRNYAKLPKDNKGELTNRFFAFGMDNVSYVELLAGEALGHKSIYQQEQLALIQLKGNLRKICAAMASKKAAAKTVESAEPSEAKSH